MMEGEHCFLSSLNSVVCLVSWNLRVMKHMCCFLLPGEYVIVYGQHQRMSHDGRPMMFNSKHVCRSKQTASQLPITCPGSISFPRHQTLASSSTFIFFHLSVHLNKIYVMSVHCVQHGVYISSKDINRVLGCLPELK